MSVKADLEVLRSVGVGSATTFTQAAEVTNAMQEIIMARAHFESADYREKLALDMDLRRQRGLVERIAQERDYLRALVTPAIESIYEERKAQIAEWGGPDHDDEHTMVDWVSYIEKHTKRILQYGKYDARKQLVIVAALAVAAIESIDRGPK